MSVKSKSQNSDREKLSHTLPARVASLVERFSDRYS
jgi:hypothetical protein